MLDYFFLVTVNTAEGNLFRVLVVTKAGFSFTEERQKSNDEIHFVCTGKLYMFSA